MRLNSAIDNGTGSLPLTDLARQAPAGASTRAATVLLAEASQKEREFVSQALVTEPHRLLSTSSCDEVPSTVDSIPVDLVILSSRGKAGRASECCRRLKASRRTELIPVLVFAGEDIHSQLQALHAGADDFLRPSAQPELARARILALLRQKAATDRLEQTEPVLFALAKTVEQRDGNTGEHCERLALYSLVLGLELGLNDEDLQALYRGGYLHDLGKVGLPDHVLLKPGPLDDKEWEAMRTHTVRGEEICRSMRSLQRVLPIIRSHHERWDGSGYPDGLRGHDIPLLARVLQLSDIYDALTNVRPYKKALAPEVALDVMSQETGRGWRDPELMSVFLRAHRDGDRKKKWHQAEDMRQSLRNLQRHLVEA